MFSIILNVAAGSGGTCCDNQTEFTTATYTWNIDPIGASVTYGSIDTWNTGIVTNMSYAFSSSKSSSIDVTSWNTSSVTDMSHMFYNAIAFNGDISGWDTSSVVNMGGMFRNAVAFTQSLPWDTSAVTDMSGMFLVEVGSSVFNGDISGWDTWQVTDMSYMFKGAVKFDGNLTTWTTSSVTTMESMFQDAAEFTNMNDMINNWDTSKVTSMYSTFNGATKFYDNYTGVWFNWDTSSVTTMNSMFKNAPLIAAVFGSKWDTSNVKDMNSMFYGATTLFTPTWIGDWNTGAVEDVSYMFQNTPQFNVNLCAWNTARVTDFLDFALSSALSLTHTPQDFGGGCAYNPVATWGLYLNFYLGRLALSHDGPWTYGIYRFSNQGQARFCENGCGLTNAGAVNAPPNQDTVVQNGDVSLNFNNIESPYIDGLCTATPCETDWQCSIKEWSGHFLGTDPPAAADCRDKDGQIGTGAYVYYCACPIATIDEIAEIDENQAQGYIYYLESTELRFDNRFPHTTTTSKIVGNQSIRIKFILTTQTCADTAIAGSNVTLVGADTYLYTTVNITDTSLGNHTAIHVCYQAEYIIAAQQSIVRSWGSWRHMGNKAGAVRLAHSPVYYLDMRTPSAPLELSSVYTTQVVTCRAGQSVQFTTDGSVGSILGTRVGFFNSTASCASMTASDIQFNCTINHMTPHHPESGIPTTADCDQNVNTPNIYQPTETTLQCCYEDGGSWHDLNGDVMPQRTNITLATNTSTCEGPPTPSPTPSPTPPAPAPTDPLVESITNATNEVNSGDIISVRFYLQTELSLATEIGFFFGGSDSSPGCNDSIVPKTTVPDECVGGSCECVFANIAPNYDSSGYPYVATGTSLIFHGPGAYTACYSPVTSGVFNSSYWYPFHNLTENVLHVDKTPSPTPSPTPPVPSPTPSPTVAPFAWNRTLPTSTYQNFYMGTISDNRDPPFAYRYVRRIAGDTPAYGFGCGDYCGLIVLGASTAKPDRSHYTTSPYQGAYVSYNDLIAADEICGPTGGGLNRSCSSDLTCSLREWVTDFGASCPAAYSSGAFVNYCACPIATIDDIHSIDGHTTQTYIYRLKNTPLVFSNFFYAPETTTNILGNQSIRIKFIQTTQTCEDSAIAGSEVPLVESPDDHLLHVTINITNTALANDTKMHVCYQAHHINNHTGGGTGSVTWEWTDWRLMGNKAGTDPTSPIYYLDTELPPTLPLFDEVLTPSIEDCTQHQTVDFLVQDGPDETMGYIVGFFNDTTCTSPRFNCSITRTATRPDGHYDATCFNNVNVPDLPITDPTVFKCCYHNDTGDWQEFSGHHNITVNHNTSACTPTPPPTPKPTHPPSPITSEWIEDILNQSVYVNESTTLVFSADALVDQLLETTIGFFLINNGVELCNASVISRPIPGREPICINPDGGAHVPCECHIVEVKEGGSVSPYIGICGSLTFGHAPIGFTACYSPDNATGVKNSSHWYPFHDIAGNVLKVVDRTPTPVVYPTPAPTKEEFNWRLALLAGLAAIAVILGVMWLIVAVIQIYRTRDLRAKGATRGARGETATRTLGRGGLGRL